MTLKKSDLESKYKDFKEMLDRQISMLAEIALQRQAEKNYKSSTVRTCLPTCIAHFGIKLENKEEYQIVSKKVSDYIKQTKNLNQWKPYHSKLPFIFHEQVTQAKEEKEEKETEQTDYINDLFPTLTSDKCVKITFETIGEDFNMCKVIKGDIGRDIAYLLVKN